jgi:hypothetical protein
MLSVSEEWPLHPATAALLRIAVNAARDTYVRRPHCRALPDKGESFREAGCGAKVSFSGRPGTLVARHS